MRRLYYEKIINIFWKKITGGLIVMAASALCATIDVILEED
ncbi:MAG: hypothetical protein VB018_09275 [Lachnospiraceae bacterium]|nr:hypothetical protein [Lachnospiraceae bacterium]